MEVPLLDGHARQQPDQPVVEIETAFIVLKTKDGKVMYTADMATPVLRERAPSNDEVTMCSWLVASHMLAQATAGTTVNMSLQMSQAMAEAQQNMALREQINKTRK